MRANLSRYSVALGVAVLALIPWLAFGSRVEPSPFPLLLAAVCAAGWYGGYGAGLTATAAATVGTLVSYRPTSDASLLVQIIFFVLVATFISFLTGQLSIFRRNTKYAQDELQRQLSFSQALTDSLGEGVYALDRDGKINFMNPRAEQMLGWSESEVQGKAAHHLFHAKKADGSRARPHEWQLLQVLRSGETVEVQDEAFTRQDGSSILVDYVSAPLVEDGQVVGAVVGFRDITERVRMEEALRAAEAARASDRLFVSLVNESPDAIVLLDARGHIEHFNSAAERMSGFSAAEMVNRGFAGVSLVAPNYRSQAIREVARVLSGEQCLPFEIDIVRKDGSLAPLEANLRVVHRAGQQSGVQMTLRDITERRRAEEAIRASEELFRSAFSNAPIGVALVSLEGRYVRVNQSLCDILGYTEAELLDTGYDNLTYDEDRPLNVEPVERLRSVEVRSHQIEKRYVHKDGHLVWVRINISLVRNGAGEPLYYVSQVEDITPRKRAEAALRESEERYRELFENANDIVFTVDLQGNFLAVNSAAERITGHSRQEALGRNIATFLAPESLALARQMIDVKLTEDRRTTYELTIVGKSGEYIPVEVSTRLVVAEGNPAGIQGIARDIRERLEIDRAKDEFISMVSHELRTPLTSIRGSLGLVAAGVFGELSPEAGRMIDIAVTNSERLVRLINDILDIERMESGTITMERRACEASELMATAADTVAGMANNAGVTVAVQPMIAEIWGDPDRLVQVFTNLLSNAIKFSPRGATVRFSMQRSDTEITFQVHDQGRGIPPDKLDSIWERFQQVDASDSREKGGTGLGLPIVRTIATQHGGQVYAESVLGEGSTFTFVLPLRTAERGAQFEPYRDGQPLVLVCGDDPATLGVLQAQLQDHEYRVATAPSGLDAVEQALALQPQAILLDITPAISSWETLAALQTERETQPIPTVVVASDTDNIDRSAVNVGEWLTKPVLESELLATLLRIIPRERRRVLVVEDDVDLARVLVTILQRHAIDTVHVQTGRAAIETSLISPPDLILLDVGISGGDGFAVVDRLRREVRLAQLPLLVYTARDLSEDERTRLRLGKTEFMTKSRITPEQVERMVVDLLGGHDGTAWGSSEQTGDPKGHP